MDNKQERARENSRNYYYKKVGHEVNKRYKTVNAEVNKLEAAKQDNLIWQLKCVEAWIKTNSCLHPDYGNKISELNNLKIRIK